MSDRYTVLSVSAVLYSKHANIQNIVSVYPRCKIGNTEVGLEIEEERKRLNKVITIALRRCVYNGIKMFVLGL